MSEQHGVINEKWPTSLSLNKLTKKELMLSGLYGTLSRLPLSGVPLYRSLDQAVCLGSRPHTMFIKPKIPERVWLFFQLAHLPLPIMTVA